MQADDSATASRRPSTSAVPPRSAAVADDLDATAIGAALRAHYSGPTWRIRVVDATGSTNSDLLREVRDGRDAGIDLPRLLVARRQTAGRGRLGRHWVGDGNGSLAVSFALRITRRLALLDGVTLVCGLAVQAVTARHRLPARLKWPNDLLVDGRKLAGILVEAVADAGDATVLVVGVGLNLDRQTAPMDTVATSFREEGVDPPARSALVADLAVALSEHLELFATRGFAPFTDAWRAADAFDGRRVVLRVEGGPPIEGTHRGVDEGGALLIDVDGAMRRFTGGEVSVRLASDGTPSR